MPKNNLHKILTKTKNKAKNIRDKVNKLKKEQNKKRTASIEEIQDLKEPRKPKKEHVVVEFSMMSIAKATLVVIGLFTLAQFLFQIGEILILVFVSLFLAAALDSIVDEMENKKIPRAASILVIYLGFFVVLGVCISTLIPLVATQTLELAQKASEVVANITQNSESWDIPYAGRFQSFIVDLLENIDQDTIISNLQTGLEQLGKQLQNIAGNTWGALKVIFDGLFNAVIIMVLTFFMVVDEKGIEAFLLSLFPSKHAKYIIEKSEAVKENVGYWLRGQFKLMVAMALLTFTILTLFGVEYALTLSLIAGITELIPVVGPIIAMLPAILIGLNESFSYAFWIFILYMVIQQLEGNILVPLIMKRAVGLSPIIIIIAMLVGYSFLGIMGTIIAVPVATAVSIFLKDYTTRRK